MKKVILSIIALSFVLFTSFSNEKYVKSENGIIATVGETKIQIQFYSSSIVRVLKSPSGSNLKKESLTVIKPLEDLKLKISNKKDVIVLKSKDIKVLLNLKTGDVLYEDLNGNSLLSEQSIESQFTPFNDAGKQSYMVKQSFQLASDEAIYGLGQLQNGNLMQNNQEVMLKNSNHNITIPYFYSIKGYSVFWDNYAETKFVDSDQETSFESLGDCVDYYFMYGKEGAGTITKMRDLTGQAPMFPLWTYGYWQSRERYKTQEELLSVVKKYRDLEVPLDGIIQDWRYWGEDSLWNAMKWDVDRFPNPKEMADKVHAMNAHLMVVAWPGFGPLTEQYAEFKDKDMLIDFDTWPPKSGTKPYDVYDAEARDIYWDYLNKGVFSKGTDAWWLDSTEPDHINVKDSDFDQQTKLGSYRSVSNAFSLEHTKGIYGHQRKTTENKRVFILTRSAFAGQQRHAANSWSGDVQSSWDALREQIPAALNFTICGIPYWNADIGGFFAGRHRKGGGVKNPEFKELYVRWAQFATFTPMMRSHGTDLPREIYQFGNRGDWAFDAIEKSIKLRYRLLPYLYSTAWKVTNQSDSFMKALPLEYPKDEKTLNITDEYVFGSSFLVAPVINQMYSKGKDENIVEDFSKVKNRSVYLPESNNWIDFWTGETIKGGQEIVRETPIDIMPLYVKAGAIIPWGPEVQYANEKNWESLEIRVYTGSDCEFTLYNDEGDNYNYEKGKYSTINFKWDDKAKILTIGEQQGDYKGIIKQYNFKIALVGNDNGVGLESSKKYESVSYNGTQKTIHLTGKQ